MNDRYESADFEYSSTHSHMKKVYGWMFIALMVTAIVSLFVANNYSNFAGLLNGPGIFILFIVELVLVFVLAGMVQKLKPATGFALFLIYAVINGIVLSGIFLVYTPESIVNTFFITAAMFGALSVYAQTTKKDLSGMGTFLFMALFGLLIASIVNIFLASTGLQWIITIAGVLIFSGLTAYDTQTIKNNPYYRQYPVMGALELYLDFINLFIYLLRIFGSRD